MASWSATSFHLSLIVCHHRNGGRGRRREEIEESITCRIGWSWLQDESRNRMEPFILKPEAMASSLLPKSTPQMDRRTDALPAPAPHRRSDPRSISSFPINLFSFIYLTNFPNLSMFFFFSMHKSRSSFAKHLLFPRKTRKRYSFYYL